MKALKCAISGFQRLERTIAAGNKLANMEEREIARMDAFRVAVSFPFSIVSHISPLWTYELQIHRFPLCLGV